MPKNTGPTSALDPRALIVESYRIDGITPADCRTIYLDWALGVDPARDMVQDTAELLAFHGESEPDHPMTAVLREGVERSAEKPRRRGRRAQ
ncbi:MAG: hypothetical protein ACPGGK_04930 [Pikeienuella sp.]